MTSVLLLRESTEQHEELSNIFHRAGYQVVQISDIAECFRFFQKTENLSASLQTKNKLALSTQKFDLPNEAPTKAITIFTTKMSETHKFGNNHLPELSAFILSLARQISPGWRLSSRERSLHAPNGEHIILTSLEYAFVKIFSMVDVGEAVSRKKIVLAFGEDYLAYDQNRLDTMVRRLRKKVRQTVGMQLPLNTVRIRGFSFDDVLILDV